MVATKPIKKRRMKKQREKSEFDKSGAHGEPDGKS